MASFMGYQLTDGKNLKSVHEDGSTLSVKLGKYRATRGPPEGRMWFELGRAKVERYFGGARNRAVKR
jgi:hypothetical protein